MNRTEAYVSLRDRGCKIYPSQTCESCYVVELPTGMVYEVWSSGLVDFAELVII